MLHSNTLWNNSRGDFPICKDAWLPFIHFNQLINIQRTPATESLVNEGN